MKIRTLVVAAIIAVPVTVSAQSRFNTASPTYRSSAPTTSTPTLVRDYRTRAVTATVEKNSQGQTVIRDYRTNGVQATVERNSQGQVIIRDYRTGRVLSTVGK